MDRDVNVGAVGRSISPNKIDHFAVVVVVVGGGGGGGGGGVVVVVVS